VSKSPSPKKSQRESPTENGEGDGPLLHGILSDLLNLLWRFRTRFREGRDADEVLRYALRLSLEFFGANEGCVATLQAGADDARIAFAVPPEAWWDARALSAFLGGEKVRVAPDLMLARIRRHGRMWGALAARQSSGDFQWVERQAFSAIAALANELIDQIDAERVREVRARVDRKVMEQSRPKHLFYEVLHGIRSLTGYDHSAALLTYEEALDSLEVAAEQIAWQKAKGENVGRKVPLPRALHDRLSQAVVFGFNRAGRKWDDWTGNDATALAEMLDFGGRAAPGLAPEAGAILCAPLAARAGLLGILKVAALHAGTFSHYEVELISQFLPQAAVALQNARRAESLEQRVLVAERKHAMADLAPGCARGGRVSMEPQGASILVVDDDPGMLHAVSRILGRRHRVTCVTSGPAAIEQAHRLRPDLAIVDIRLPETSGFEVTRALKSALRDIDVILMTGNAEEPDDNLVQAIVEGAFYFIQKPFDRRVLPALVTRCLELRRLREERDIFLRRVERELEEARQFQLSLLPAPHFERGVVSIDARYVACNELAGDFCDYAAVGDGTLCLVAADAVGHGTSAAMMTGVVKPAFRASRVDSLEPRAVVERVREGIRDFDASRFVTLCCGRIERDGRDRAYDGLLAELRAFTGSSSYHDEITLLAVDLAGSGSGSPND
jgi:CheY-like chemotaxis protein/GAF domain-containing protein